MACRSMMLKLHNLELIKLPERRRTPSNRMAQKNIPLIPHERSPIESSLRCVQKIRIETNLCKQDDDLFSCLLSQYHYLGYKGIVGENMKYLIFDQHNHILACLLFGSAAWKAQGRDSFIGWDKDTRERNLNLTTNNMRFLILPWVRVKHLASHILGRISRRISKDWMEKYGHPVYLIETFVEKDRFQGTCYKAANWIYVGETSGRSRNDRFNTMQVPIKDIFLYPLIADFKDKLAQNV